jgi:hypothetical protein
MRRKLGISASVANYAAIPLTKLHISGDPEHCQAVATYLTQPVYMGLKRVGVVISEERLDQPSPKHFFS